MYIYGIHPTEELLETAPNQVRSLHAADQWAPKLKTVRRLADAHDLEFEQTPADQLDRMADGGHHQGVIARTRPFEYASLDELLERTADTNRACALVLDQIQDPHNLGAILRSAAAMGADGVVVPKDRAAGVTAAVVRASAGQALRVPVIRITNVARTLDLLKDHGWWTAGAHIDGPTTDLWDMDFDMKAALVVGSEHRGIRRLVGQTCDFNVRIPIAEDVDSLNAASAASVLLYEVRRQWQLSAARRDQ